MTYTDDVLHWAARYAAVGWPQIILPYGHKSPQKVRGWQQARPTVDDIIAAVADGPINLGVLLGEPAGGLLRVDPDCVEMMRACTVGLPHTDLKMSREGQPHTMGYFYLVDGPLSGPMTIKDPTQKGDDATLVDLIWTGKQSVLPPSLHPDGSHYRWVVFGPPASVPAQLIEQRVQHCASAALLARHWPDGGRHDTMLAVAGGLLAAGWTPEDVEAWAIILLAAAEDDEAEDRIRAIYDTADRLTLEREAVGFTRLAEYIDPRIVRRVCDLLGVTEDRRAARAQLADDLRCTDEGNAERLAAMFTGQIRYVAEHRRWLFWDGTRWAIEGRRSIMTCAIEVARSLHAEAAAADTKDKRSTLSNWAVDSESMAHLSAMGSVAQGLTPLRASATEFDADSWRLNVKNGTLDLRTLTLADHDPADLHTLVAGAEYNPRATCTRYEKFLDEIFNGDVELIEFVQRAAGLCLTGSMREEVFFLCWGDGSNGKSKLLGAWRDALGEYAGTTPFDTFDGDANRSGPGNDLAALKGKRLVTAIETDHERRLAEAKVKRVTGGDPVSCRRLYGEFFEYFPTWKLWLAINHRPVIRGTDYGIWRRVLLIPFTRQFDGSLRDLDLEAQLRDEKAGVLRWMVDGLRSYHAIGLAPPPSVLAAVDEYKTEMNFLADFVQENCEPHTDALTPARDLYLRYTYWTKDFGERQLPHRTFAIQLKRLGYEPHVSNGVRYWRGVRLRPESFLSQTPVINGVHAP